MSGFIFYLIAIAVVIGAGGLLHFLVQRTPQLPSQSVTKTEWVAGSLIASLIVIPIVTVVGGHMAQANAATYHEYWSGLEKSADVSVTTCTKDGPCVHEYDCDPYIVMVTKYRTESYTTTESDGKGGTRVVTKTRQVPYQEPETRYHDCPYVDKEYSYTVSDTMGETYTFGSHWFPTSPEDHKWRGFGSEYRSLPNVPTGQPKQWVAAKARIDAGKPGGTTQRHSYKNFILASQDDIYAKHSEAINSFLKGKLLPKVQTEVYDEYHSNKVYFVGSTPSDAAAYQQAELTLNGYLGKERQGDLHVVMVDTKTGVDPDEYTQALNAYWQSEKLGKDTLSKNGVAVVLGVNYATSTVEWGRGFTGMPMGNEGLVQSFTNLKDASVSPEALFGDNSAVGNLLFDEANGYTRVEMKNYDYLKDSVKIGTGARVIILLIALVLSMGIWALMFTVDLRWTPIENFREFFGKENGKKKGAEAMEEETVDEMRRFLRDPDRYMPGLNDPDWK